jgi:hypothetical protein
MYSIGDLRQGHTVNLGIFRDNLTLETICLFKYAGTTANKGILISFSQGNSVLLFTGFGFSAFTLR